MFVEAEDFTINGEGWSIKESSRHFKAPFISNFKTLSGATEGQGTASTEVDISEDGEYLIWVRHAEFPKVAKGWRAPFDLTITQGETKPAYKQTYDHKLFKTGVGGNAVWARYHWVPSRDWEIRESFTVPLKKGKATLTISKQKPYKCHPHVRQVDCVLLTMDTEYKPEYRDFAPQTYMRIRLHGIDVPGCYFYTFIDQMREPWYRNIAFDKGGFAASIQGDRSKWLKPGEQTPWVNISRVLYTGWTTNFFIHAQVVYGHKAAGQSHYSVDFATAPDESAIVRTIERKGPGPAIAIRATDDLTDGKLPRPDYEFAKETADVVATFPKIAFGKRPAKFPVLLGYPTNESRVSDLTGHYERQSLAWMGINGNSSYIQKQDYEDGVIFGRLQSSIWHMGPGGFNEPDIQELNRRLKNQAKKLADYPYMDRMVQNKLMDEASASSLALMVKRDVDQKAFREWVDDRGYLPFDLGVETFDELSMTDDRDHEEPLLYYLSQKFRAWSVARFFRIASDAVHKHLGKEVQTTQNFSDGAVYMANMYMQGNDYWEWFENQQSLDIAMSEDWTNSGATNQLTSWNVNLLRAASRKHGQPIHMYVITSYGRRPLDIKLKAYSNIAQGAKMLNFYAYQPVYAGHERGWYQQWPRYAAVAETCHEIGAAEDVLMDAMPKPADTAILYSTSYDLWAAGHDNILAMERMMTYIALRHAQIPVDVISEREAKEGALSNYKVVYLFGEQIDTKCIAPLAKWVKAGGTLTLSPGAASRTKLNAPTTKLDKALQLKRNQAQTLQAFRHSSVYMCRLLKEKGTVTIAGDPAGKATLAYRKQTFGTMKDAKPPRATFKDGTPAEVEVARGKGRVVMVGFLPAVSYTYQARKAFEAIKDSENQPMVRPLALVCEVMKLTEQEHKQTATDAIRVRKTDHSLCPDEFDAAHRRFIAVPAVSADVELPVTLSHPVVEATMMQGEVGWVVPLANYTTKTIEQLEVTILPNKACGELYSARQGKLPVEKLGGGQVKVVIPLESTDFVFARWQ